MIALITALTLAPLVLFGSYQLQRRREINRKQRAGRSPGGAPKSNRRRDSRHRQNLRRLGYRYADDQIFIHGTGVFTGMVLDTSTDEFATGTEIGDTAMRPVGIYRELLGLFDGKEVPCHERVCYRPITTEGWLAQLLANAWNPTGMYKILSAKVAGHITHSTPQRMWTLIVRLGDCPPPTGTDPFAEISAGVLGVAEERLTVADLAPWWALADILHDVTGRHGAEPLTRRDLLWLIRKPSHGHLPVPDAPVTSRRPWRGGFFELAASIRGSNLGGGYIQLNHRNPQTGAEETSYTATLVVADQPPRQVFNARTAWSRRLGRLARPAEISWRYTLIPPAHWKRMADKAVSNLEDERRDREKAGAEEDLSFEARRDQAEQIKADNADDDTQPGMIGVSASPCPLPALSCWPGRSRT